MIISTSVSCRCNTGTSLFYKYQYNDVDVELKRWFRRQWTQETTKIEQHYMYASKTF